VSAEVAIWDAIDEFVEARTGLCLDTLPGEMRRHVVSAAMQGAGVPGPRAYLERLQLDPRAFDDLIAKLTIPETYFFRDAAMFTSLRTEFIPELFRLRGATHRLRIWSAGCASGEEPYSLAILLDQLGEGGRAHLLLGSDLSRPVVERARHGDYGAWSLRAVSKRVISEYFEKTPHGFRLDARICGMVQFHHHNLADRGSRRRFREKSASISSCAGMSSSI